MKSLAILLLVNLSTSMAFAIDPPLERFEFGGREMAAPVKIVIYATDEAAAKRAADAAFARIRELTAAFSDFDASSEIRRLCERAAAGDVVQVSEDLWRLLRRAEEFSRASLGAFDITVGPVIRLWRQARKLGKLPDPERLAEARALVDYRLVEIEPDRRAVKLGRPGVRIDLGGIAAGYAADEALRAIREQGLDRALVDIGGDLALGAPPPGARGWRIGISRHDAEPSAPPDLLLSGVGVSTSGDSVQFVVIDGQRYSHIVDPRTGLGKTDHSHVTVVARDATTADALTTAVSVLGPRDGLGLIESTEGAAGRIVVCPGTEMSIVESREWKGLAAAEPAAADPASSGPPAPPPPVPAPPVPSPPASEAASSAPPTPPSGGGSPSPAPGPAPGAVRTDLTVTPPVLWMLEPTALPAAEAKGEAEMKPYAEQIPGTNVSFEMVPIPGGKFILGSPSSEPGHAADEEPSVEIEIEPFWMGKCEVRWEEYELWGLGYDALRKERTKEEATPRDSLADAITRPTKPYCDMTFGMGKEGYPAICMTQLAAKVYCKWLSAKTGRYYRLPTEAEWEYACRAGTRTAYSFGDDPKLLPEYGWFFDNSDSKYQPVGKKKPNPWGLHDMHGNVAEWVIDRYTPDGYKAIDAGSHRNPVVVPEELYPRSARGGSWMDDADRLRSAARRGSDPFWMKGDPQMPKSIWYHTDATFVGFRVVRPLRVPAAAEAAHYDIDPSQKETFAEYMEYLSGRH